MNPNDNDRYAAVERRHRVQIIAGLRAAGLNYHQINTLLGVPLRQIETVLGEAEALRAQGFRSKEIAAEIGIPVGSLGRVLPPRRRGTVTARQDEVLDGVTQMRGMQVDTLAEYLNVLESTAYALVRELIGKGMLCELTKVQRGRAWVYAPPQVERRYLGWKPGEWTPPLMYAEHYRAVAQARIMLVGSDRRAFISERTLRHDANRTARITAEKRRAPLALEFSTGREPLPGRPHIHDGRFLGVVRGTYGWWALEVELSVKDAAYMDTALRGAIRAAHDAHPYSMVGLLYLCRSAAVLKNVEAAAGRLEAEAEFANSDLALHIQDFDKQWDAFLEARHELREAKREEKREAKRQRRNLLHISQEAS